MKQKQYQLNTLLAAITAAALLLFSLLRTFLPALILPALSIPNLVLISLAALLTDYFLSPDAGRNYGVILLFSFLTFGVLPLASGLADTAEALKLAAGGAAVFTAVTFLFTSLTDRLATGRTGKAGAVAGALGLYLASQAFMGILL